MNKFVFVMVVFSLVGLIAAYPVETNRQLTVEQTKCVIAIITSNSDVMNSLASCNAGELSCIKDIPELKSCFANENS
jgi:hypothetical protein